MIIFDGKKFAAEKEKALKERLTALTRIIPVTRLKLVSILVGDNPESELYVSLKKKAADRVGVEMEVVRFSDKVSSEEVIKYIEELNKDSKVHGIMVQLPLSKSLEIRNLKLEILGSIEPSKDVDCLTPENLGLLMMGGPRFLPATVKAIIEILGGVILGSEATPESDPGQARMTEKKWLAGKNVCLVGASEIVGKPLAMVLSDAGATVTLCRSTTKNLTDFTKKADILISAVGLPGLIKKEMVKEGAVVIDVGTKKLKVKSEKLKVLGDVERDVAEVAGFLTPVPGGVGPVTVICLLENLLEAINL